MKKLIISILALAAFFTGCIGDDIIMDQVPEAVRILNPLDTLGVGETYQFEATFTNNIGAAEARSVIWDSSDTSIISLDDSGLATAVAKGVADISARVGIESGASVVDIISVVVDEETVVMVETKMGELKSTSSYNLQGSFTMAEMNGKLIITFSDDYEASTALPGLYVYLGNNQTSISSAFEIGAVTVYDGAHTYEIESVGINDYKYLLYWCKPFNVKVGEGAIE